MVYYITGDVYLIIGLSQLIDRELVAMFGCESNLKNI